MDRYCLINSGQFERKLHQHKSRFPFGKVSSGCKQESRTWAQNWHKAAEKLSCPFSGASKALWSCHRESTFFVLIWSLYLYCCANGFCGATWAVFLSSPSLYQKASAAVSWRKTKNLSACKKEKQNHLFLNVKAEKWVNTFL